MVTLYAEADFRYPGGRRLRQRGHAIRTAPGRLSLWSVARAYVDHMGGLTSRRTPCAPDGVQEGAQANSAIPLSRRSKRWVSDVSTPIAARWRRPPT